MDEMLTLATEGTRKLFENLGDAIDSARLGDLSIILGNVADAIIAEGGDSKELIHQIDQLEILTRILTDRSARPLIYSNLAGEIQVSVDTVRRWIEVLSSLHLGFRLRPWFRNVSRSLRKEPKWYLRDWAGIEDTGSRAETFVGCHLLKAVEGWTDLGLGKFELAYLRDKHQREVDFAVIRDGKPWILIEVKHRDTSLVNTLTYFQEQLKAPFAFQVVIEAEYVDTDCFKHPGPPLMVPARTFLSQLL